MLNKKNLFIGLTSYKSQYDKTIQETTFTPGCSKNPEE